MDKILLSLVIPCYNEARGLPELIHRLGEVFGNVPRVEVILVDNGSEDNSGSIIQNALAVMPFLRTVKVERNQGYGYGILQGLKQARGTRLGWTHADLQTDPADVLKVLESLNRDDMYGRAFYKGLRQSRPLTDRLFTMGMSIFESILFRRKLWDINAQPTVFTKEFFESWREPPHDFSLDLYAYAKARRSGLEVVRFPVEVKLRRHGSSSWNSGLASRFRLVRRTMNYSFCLHRMLSSNQ